MSNITGYRVNKLAQAIALSCIGLALGACSKEEAPKESAKAAAENSQASQKPQRAIPVVQVESISKKKGSISDQLSLDGKVEGSKGSSLYSPSQAIVNKVLVQQGQSVKKGQLLMLLNSDELAIEYQVALSKVQASSSGLNAIKNEYDRAQLLFKKGFVSQADLEKSKANLDQAVTNQAIAQLDLEKAKTRRSFLELKAPFDAIVVSVNTAAGAQALPNQELIKLASNQAPSAFVMVPSLVSIQNSRLELDQESLKVVGQSTELDSSMGAYKVFVELSSNQAKNYKMGGSFTAQLLNNEKQGIKLPATAVTLKGDKQYLTCLDTKGERLSQIPIQIQAKAQGFVLLDEKQNAGLEDKKCIMQGANLYNEGERVQVKETTE